jgi:CBS domain-containing protein
MRVSQLMSQPPVTCSSSSTLNQAAQLMWEHDCGAVPVVDGEGKVAGIVTDRDICMAAYTRGEPLSAIPVTVAMAKSVVCCHPDDDVESAESIMGEQQVRRLPVVDAENHLLGLLSIGDLAQEMARPRSLASGTPREFLTMVGAISRPRSAGGPSQSAVESTLSAFAASAG